MFTDADVKRADGTADIGLVTTQATDLVDNFASKTFPWVFDRTVV